MRISRNEDHNNINEDKEAPSFQGMLSSFSYAHAYQRTLRAWDVIWIPTFIAYFHTLLGLRLGSSTDGLEVLFISHWGKWNRQEDIER